MALSGSGLGLCRRGGAAVPSPVPSAPCTFTPGPRLQNVPRHGCCPCSLTQWAQPPLRWGHGQARLGTRSHAGWGAERTCWVRQRPDPQPPPARPLLLPHPQS